MDGKHNQVNEQSDPGGGNEERFALGVGCRSRLRSGRHLLLLGRDHGRVLPPVVRGAPCPTRECTISCELQRRRRCRIPPMQTVQAQSTLAGRATRDESGGSMPVHRDIRGTAHLQRLANHMRISTYHFHRVFKAITGVTPKEYAVAHRAKRVRRKLGKGGHGNTSDIRCRVQL